MEVKHTDECVAKLKKLGYTDRSINVMFTLRITSLEQLQYIPIKKLTTVRNCGVKTVENLRRPIKIEDSIPKEKQKVAIKDIEEEIIDAEEKFTEDANKLRLAYVLIALYAMSEEHQTKSTSIPESKNGEFSGVIGFYNKEKQEGQILQFHANARKRVCSIKGKLIKGSKNSSWKNEILDEVKEQLSFVSEFFI